MGELQEPTGCFLKNMHKGTKHNQNVGKSVLNKWPKMTVKMIKLILKVTLVPAGAGLLLSQW
eukprot:1351680-Ditylum_brightwellii.AAC.1